MTFFCHPCLDLTLVKLEGSFLNIRKTLTLICPNTLVIVTVGHDVIPGFVGASDFYLT